MIKQGEIGDCMYFIDRGRAAAEIDGTFVMGYVDGDYFGELALRSSQVRATHVHG